MKIRFISLLPWLLWAVLVSCGEPTPTATPSPTGTPTAVPATTPTFTPTPTVTPTPTPAPTATATATPTPSPIPTVTFTPTATAVPTATPTPTFTPTPTQVPGRPGLYKIATTPEHMTYLWWGWGTEYRFEELVIDFTIHNNVELGGQRGLYLMLGHLDISDTALYFGLQTNVYSPDPPHSRGKGLLFSRWGTRDLANARWHQAEGWNQSSGHEGDFIGVRRAYRWGVGDYRVRIAPDGAEPDGVWFGLWITDKASGVETWIGSLKFPIHGGRAVMSSPSYSTIEIYGDPIRPIDIPVWHVSIERPVGDGVRALGGDTGYSVFYGEIMNSDVRYDRADDVVHLKTGGLTERRTEAGRVRFR